MPNSAELQLQSTDYAVIAAYFVGILAVGVYVSVQRREEDDHFLAGRSFGWFNVGLSVFGTNINPSFLIASASAAYATGMATANFEWMAWPFLLLLAMVFAPHYLNTRVTTMPQFVRRRFGPASAEFLSWYALLSTIVLWLGGALYTGGLLLSQILDIPLWGAVVALTGVATFLTVAGGLAVIMVTDMLQSLLMIAGASTVTFLGLYHIGGLENLLAAVPADRWALIRPANDPDYPWIAMVLGYPVLGVWFWCTDQTIVQRILGARDLKQAQLGALFTGFLKVATPFIFTLPGIMCAVLHPKLEDSDQAFLTMVNYLPVGMVGLIVAVLIAALISTIDSGLNSFSTIFTLDIYQRKFRPDASPQHIKTVGRVVTIGIAIVSIGIALSMQSVGKNLFDLLQSIIAYFAPPMAAVFLIGILWRGATATAALWTLVCGSAVSLGFGLIDFFKEPITSQFGIEIQLPHFLMMSFYLFSGISLFMILLSLVTENASCEEHLPSPNKASQQLGSKTGLIWAGWALLALIMIGIYVLFSSAEGTSALN
ncbi:sodium:solute symporter family transporter [Adhaeretor mobilis]|uniref:Sodium/glucose cotransporter n=1 Tax=Adhaeretor mobilis TaxID=1930276 RepID=A0A517MZR1_9BACT|nr:sodium/solute symporter [Adhaeretor mobilis]QDT00376.1 Sodium/glucose cotransporter [Adhaeretor mobilis]